MGSARSEPDRQSRDTVGPLHICPTHIADWLPQAARAVLSAPLECLLGTSLGGIEGHRSLGAGSRCLPTPPVFPIRLQCRAIVIHTAQE